MPSKHGQDAAQSFGKRLAALRKAAGYTQQQLSDEVGVSRRMIAYYETETGHPPTSFLIDLARALNVTTDELLGLVPAPTADTPSGAVQSPRAPAASDRAPRAQAQAADPRLHRHRRRRRAAATESLWRVTLRSSLLEEAERLPIEERLELVEALWDSIAADAGVDQVPVPQWHLEELDKRIAEYDADPEEGSSWEEVRARLEQRD